MSIRSRRFWTIAAPLALGVVLLIVFGGMNAFRSGSRGKGESKPADAGAPENPAHERAALEEQLKVNPNHPPILFRLAELERDAGRPAGAVPYLRKILESDPKNVDARLELSRMLYESGDTGGALAETKQLLTDHPHQVDALYNLGAIYDKGIGVQRDVAQAMHWFLLAADQRDTQAQLNIALFYLNGDGVPKDIAQAETWLRRAAINGNRRAQAILEAGRYRNQ